MLENVEVHGHGFIIGCILVFGVIGIRKIIIWPAVEVSYTGRLGRELAVGLRLWDGHAYLVNTVIVVIH